MSELPCPNCGSDLTFFDQYQRHYCQRCQRYAPEGYGAKGAKKCPTCGGILSYVALYDRFYCYRCNAYAPVETSVPIPLQPSPTAEPARTAEPPPEAKPTEPVATVAMSTAEIVTEKPAQEPRVSPETPTAATIAPAETAPAAPATVPAEVTPAKSEETEPEAEMEPPTPPSIKPAVLRLKIFSMKKAELVNLCKSYRLDSNGTKEELQERLLSHLKEFEAAEESEAEAPEEEPVEPAIPAATPPETRAEMPVEEPAPSALVVPVAEEVPRVEPSVPIYVGTRPAESSGAVVVTVPETAEQEFAPKVEHPCPTCGRELSYIVQYGRWYCYSCQRYAPAIAAKNACPTCGMTMRWIDQYERWWCDSCRKYASADLPRPAKGAAVATPATQAAMETAVAAKPAAAVAHRHGNPASGVGLIVFGLLLYVVYEAFVVFPLVLQYTPPFTLTADQAALLNFFAFLLVAGGAVAGISALKHRE